MPAIKQKSVSRKNSVIESKIDLILGKLEKHDRKFERILEEFAEHKRLMNTFVIKEEFYEFKDEVYTKLDGVMAILERWDQERVCTNHAIDRHETMLVSLNTKVGLPHLA
ncbi:MAG: hypothetical protein WC882_00015 [Candidatus Gracilibacteria bacterium]